MASQEICKTVRSQIIGLLTIADHKPPTTHFGKQNWMQLALETLLRAELQRIEQKQ